MHGMEWVPTPPLTPMPPLHPFTHLAPDIISLCERTMWGEFLLDIKFLSSLLTLLSYSSDKGPQDRLNNRNLFSHSSGGWKSKISPADEGSLPDCFLFSHMQRRGELQGLSYKDTSSIGAGFHTSNLISFQPLKASISKAVICGQRQHCNIYIWAGDTFSL